MTRHFQDGARFGKASVIVAVVLGIACIVLGTLLFLEKGTSAQLAAQNAEYQKQIAEYRESVAQLEKNAAELESKLKEAGIGVTRYDTRTVTEYVYIYVEPEPQPSPEPEPIPVDTSNIVYQADVTAAMASSDFWIDLAQDPDAILADAAKIAYLNEATLATPETEMFDLANMGLSIDFESAKQGLANEEVPDSDLCRNGEWMSAGEKDAYFQAMRDNILGGDAADAAAGTGRYGIITERADMHSWPSPDYIGYEPGDRDDELMSSSLNVGEPFVAMLVTADGRFCWGYSTNCTGWIETSQVAWCNSKDAWLAEWSFGFGADDFLVVTAPRIILEPSITDATSELQLMLGTYLRLVPDDELPLNVYERNTWHNHVVSLPVRTADGTLGHAYGLIPQTASVHVGYLPLTQRNLLQVAFNCLGARYGWGGQYGAMDCSMLARSIYRCFGYELPRNTYWQYFTPSDNIAIDAAMGHNERTTLLSNLIPGTLLEFDGHITMYVGSYEGKPYVISDLGSVYDTTKPKTFQWVYNVSLTSTEVERGSAAENGGYTWTDWFRIAIRPWMTQ